MHTVAEDTPLVSECLVPDGDASALEDVQLHGSDGLPLHLECLALVAHCEDFVEGAENDADGTLLTNFFVSKGHINAYL